MPKGRNRRDHAIPFGYLPFSVLQRITPAWGSQFTVDFDCPGLVNFFTARKGRGRTAENWHTRFISPKVRHRGGSRPEIRRLDTRRARATNRRVREQMTAVRKAPAHRAGASFWDS